MSLREQVAAGHEANMLLENETMKKAFREAEAKMISDWINSPEDDQWARENAYQRLHALYAVQKELKILLDNGNVAARILEKEK